MSPERTPELTREEMREILKEIARDEGENASYRVRAIRTLRELKLEDEAESHPTEFDQLDAGDQLAARRRACKR